MMGVKIRSGYLKDAISPLCNCVLDIISTDDERIGCKGDLLDSNPDTVIGSGPFRGPKASLVNDWDLSVFWNYIAPVPFTYSSFSHFLTFFCFFPPSERLHYNIKYKFVYKKNPARMRDLEGFASYQQW